MRGDSKRGSPISVCKARVELAGWKSGAEVRAALLASRAMVLPSFAEGLPVVIMEALALHRPVVSTYVAGIPELVEDGVCGRLVPAGSVDAAGRSDGRRASRLRRRTRGMGAEGARRRASNIAPRRKPRELAR